MVAPSAGEVALVPFPFTDLSQAKLRPAVVLADAGRGDWVLCQVTSNPYGDAKALPPANADFESGSLQRESFARPGKLFTGNQRLLVAAVGKLRAERFGGVLDAVIRVLRGQ